MRQAWVAVGELQPGEEVATADGGRSRLVAKERRGAGPEYVYNLEVWRDHNFHVGAQGVLVHNNCAEKFKKTVSESAEYARSLGNYIIKAGKSFEIKGNDLQAIIAKYKRALVCFDDFGFPDMLPFVKKINGVECIVNIGEMDPNGHGDKDYPKANKALSEKLKLSKTVKFEDKSVFSDGIKYVWHHHQDGKHMMLIPESVNRVSHAGGVATTKHKLASMLPDPWRVKKYWLKSCK